MIDPCSISPNRLLSLSEALSGIESFIQPIRGIEHASLDEAYGRILAENAITPINLPFERNAAMDGYALNHEDIKNQSFTLKLIGTSWAGSPYQGSLPLGHCVRIFTGATIPEGADSVVMQELINVEGNNVHFPPGVKAGANVRQAGEEFRPGDTLCEQGKLLEPADLSLLASAGFTCLPVVPRLRVAFFSTGDELIPPGQALSAGKIYESNRFALKALLSHSRFACTACGLVDDNPERIRSLISHTAEAHDVIISTGGASVGDADHIKSVLTEIGQVHLWKLAIKPGKPLLYGKIGACHFFGLPGNPVSMMITFQQVVLPMLDLLCGYRRARPLKLSAVCTETLKKSPGRMEFQRGILTQDEDGQLFVRSTGHQGSHLLSSMSLGNCFIVLPTESTGVKAGEKVIVEPFDCFK